MLIDFGMSEGINLEDSQEFHVCHKAYLLTQNVTSIINVKFCVKSCYHILGCCYFL